MTLDEVVIEGTVQPDGTLVLAGPTGLPAGRVQVRVQSRPELPPGDPFWDMMQSIWAGQRPRGFAPRSAEVIAAERREVGEQWEERLRAIEQLQRDSRRQRDQQP